MRLLFAPVAPPRPRGAGAAAAALLLPLLTLCGLLAAAPAAGQVQYVEQAARVEVPVYEDNLDDARRRAIAAGQAQAVRAVIESLVADKWVQVFEKQLRQRILADLDRYLSSFRVERSEASLDRTRYTAAVAAQINRTRLTEDLRALGLPLLSDPVRGVTLYYPADDPVLANARLREAVLEPLRGRLELLRFELTGLQPLTAAEAEAMAGARAAVRERVRLLRRQDESDGLFLRFEPVGAGAAESERAPGLQGRAVLYHRATGAALAEFEHLARDPVLRPPLRSGEARQQVLATVVTPLVERMLPGTIGPLRRAGAGAPELQLRVLGLTSIADEEAFERAFLKRGTPFERFNLYILGDDSVTYRGPFGGDALALEEELPGQQVGDFVVRNVYWYNDVLELEVARRRRPERPGIRVFPPEARPVDVATTIEDYLSRFSELEVSDPVYAEAEDNGWVNKANPLPFNDTVYGYLDSRGDSDFYMGEALASGEEVVLVWHRISRTHLSPAVRIYDASGTPVQEYTPRSWLRYTYTVPPGEHAFYIEIADRFGHLRLDTGGYLNFAYLFEVKRQSPGEGTRTASSE